MPLTRQRQAELLRQAELAIENAKGRKRRRSAKAESGIVQSSSNETTPKRGSETRKRRKLAQTSKPSKKVPSAVPPEAYKSTFQFSDLPDAAIIALLKRVPLRDRIVAERVSLRLYNLIQESFKQERTLDAWQVVEKPWLKYGEPTGEPQIFLQQIFSRVGQNLQRLDFSSCTPFRMSRFTLELIGNHCPNLKDLNLSTRYITASALEGLRTLPSCLTALNISRCFESTSYETKKAVDRALTSVLTSLPNLTSLNAEHVKSEASWGRGGVWMARLNLRSLAVGTCPVSCDAFTSFITANTGFIREFRASESTFASGNWSTVDRSRKLLKKALFAWKDTLEVLELRDFSGTYSADLGQAVKQIPTLKNLRVLNLKSNRFTDDALLTEIVEECVLLESINLSRCFGLKRKGLDKLRKLTNLKCLELRRLAVVDDGLVHQLCLNGLLSVVDLRECTRVTRAVLDDLILNCPYLERVELVGCKRIPMDLQDEYSACSHIQINTRLPATASAAGPGPGPSAT